MKYSPYILGLLIGVASFSVKAQTPENVAVLSRGCNAIFLQFGWQDGQAVLLRSVQEVIRTMKLPKDFTITPKEAIDTLANMNAIEIPQLIFHCTTDDQQVSTNVVAKFYFSYILPDQTSMRTPEFVVTKVAPTPETAPTLTKPIATPTSNATTIPTTHTNVSQ